jgi:hypothetical protein
MLLGRGMPDTIAAMGIIIIVIIKSWHGFGDDGGWAGASAKVS